MAAEDRATQAAALIDAANRLKAGGGSVVAHGDAIDGTPSTTAAATPPARDNVGSSAASDKHATCLRLNNELANDQARQRAPNSGPAMAQLRQQVRDVDDRLRAAGC